jgi:hypothetical protein
MNGKCPKCDSSELGLVCLDSMFVPNLVKQGILKVGDLYSDIAVLQCKECKCNFIELGNRGFISVVNSIDGGEGKSNVSVRTVECDCDGISGEEKKEFIDNVIERRIKELNTTPT